MIVAIPLQIKALPAALEERVETDIVRLFRTFDFTSLHQVARFIADLLPMILQGLQLREICRFKVRLCRNFGEQIQEAIDWSQERGMVAQLASQFMANVAPQVHMGNG